MLIKQFDPNQLRQSTLCFLTAIGILLFIVQCGKQVVTPIPPEQKTYTLDKNMLYILDTTVVFNPDTYEEHITITRRDLQKVNDKMLKRAAPRTK